MIQDVAVQVDDEGHILIPQALQQRLKLSAGMTLVVEESALGEIRLNPQTEPPRLVEEDGILVATGEMMADVTNIVQRVRDQRLLELLQLAVS